MKRSLFFFVALSASALLFESSVKAVTISPKTLQEAEAYSAEDLQEFRESGYQLSDPASDYALLQRAELVPARIIKTLTNTQQEIEPINQDEDYEDTHLEPLPADQPLGSSSGFTEYCLQNSSAAGLFAPVRDSAGMDSEEQMQRLLAGIDNIGKSIQGKQNPIRRDGFSKMFAEVMKEEEKNGIEPSYGQPHEWSKEFLDKYGHTSPMLVSSKLLMALAVGDTSRYMRTDKEGDLYKWMVSQPDSSLTIPEVFRQSYRLNSGDVYKTLLTIENVMAHQWRNPNRDDLPLTHRLKPITNGHEYAGDRFGTWYHFFGIMLYGYVEGGVKAGLIGRIEALGSFILTPSEVKTQKAHMNKQGGLVGDDLAKLVKTKSYETLETDSSSLAEGSYLDHTEDFRDRIKVVLSSEIKASLQRDEDRGTVLIRDTKRSLRDCKVEVMPDSTGWGFDASDKTVTEHVDLGSQFNYVPVFNRDLRAVRGFISCPDMPETLVFEAK